MNLSLLSLIRLEIALVHSSHLLETIPPTTCLTDLTTLDTLSLDGWLDD